MGLGGIRWLAILLPAVSVGVFEFLRHRWLASVLPEWLVEGWTGDAASALVVAAIVYVFVRVFVNILHELALEAARSREEAAVLLERQRIAREMHDGVAQTLFYLTVKLRAVDGLLSRGEDERARGELLVAEDCLKDAYQEAREVISDLKRHAELEDFGGSVRRAVAETERLGVRVDCEVEGCDALPAPSRRHLLAIIQEALTNARRHGGARRAAVSVRETDDGVAVEVTDGGAGFDPGAVPREGRYGLAIMEERAHMVGGSFTLDSSPGEGTRVTVRVPA